MWFRKNTTYIGNFEIDLALDSRFGNSPSQIKGFHYIELSADRCCGHDKDRIIDFLGERGYLPCEKPPESVPSSERQQSL